MKYLIVSSNKNILLTGEMTLSIRASCRAAFLIRGDKATNFGSMMPSSVLEAGK
jgi:hypothetical protein